MSKQLQHESLKIKCDNEENLSNEEKKTMTTFMKT